MEQKLGFTPKKGLFNIISSMYLHSYLQRGTNGGDLPLISLGMLNEKQGFNR